MIVAPWRSVVGQRHVGGRACGVAGGGGGGLGGGARRVGGGGRGGGWGAGAGEACRGRLEGVGGGKIAVAVSG